MDLRAIRERIALARARLDAINPDIGCHLVVMVGSTQLDPDLFESASTDLGRTPQILVADASANRLLACRDRLVKLRFEIEALQKRIDTEARREIAGVIQQHDIRISRKPERRDALLAACRKATWEAEQHVRSRYAEQLTSHNRTLEKHADRFATIIRQVTFREARVELRFDVLDIEHIQLIKQHSIVQEVGQTPLSEAGIRVVLA